MMKNKLLYIIALVLGFTACKDYDPDVSVSDSSFHSNLSTLEILELRGYTLFVDAVAHAGIASELSGSDTVTVFAPTNAAFATYLSNAGAATITDIDADDLADVLRYHVVNGAFTSASTDAILATALSGSNLYPTYSLDGTVGLNGKATITEADLYSADGVAHGISRVEDVPAASVFSIIEGSADHATLEGLLVRVGLDATLSAAGSFTLFAPNDAAFTAAGLDAATLAGMTDGAVDSVLRFHAFGSRAYQTAIADGRTSSLVAASGFQQLLEFNAADQEINGVAFDSTNFNSENGVVHFIGSVLQEEDVIADFFNAGWSALVTAAGLEDNYNSVDSAFSIALVFGGGEPTVASFAGDTEAMTDWLMTYTFSDEVAYASVASGTKVTSKNGSEFYIQGDAFNESAIDTDFSESTYNGYYNEILSYPTPLPDEDITDVLEDNGFPILAAAIRVADRADQVDASNTTFYAVPDGAVTFYFGYSDPADLDTLSEGGQEDVEVIEALQQFIDNQTVSGEITGAVLIADDLPDQTAVSGTAISWILDSGGDPVVVLDAKDPDNENIGLASTTSIFANNGVIVVMGDVFPDPE